MAGTLFVVATPIGNLEDITVRALRVLGEASLIAAEDTRRTAHLLARYAITTRTTSLHAHNEREKTVQLVQRLEAGESIALVSDAGTPTVSDPGSYLIATAIQRGIKVEPIPGPSAAIAAVSVMGHTADSFTFAGFPPSRSKARKEWFSNLKRGVPVVVFYEAPHRIRQSLQDLKETVGDIHVMVARELTKAHEELVRGPISEVLAGNIRALGEFTVVAIVGHTTETGTSGAGQVAVAASSSPSDADLAQSFGEITKNTDLNRRGVLAAVAKRHGVSQRHVYQAIERTKKLVG